MATATGSDGPGPQQQQQQQRQSEGGAGLSVAIPPDNAIATASPLSSGSSFRALSPGMRMLLRTGMAPPLYMEGGESEWAALQAFEEEEEEEAGGEGTM